MRLAIVRQRYTPFGGAERFVEAAMDSLAGAGVAVSIYTRQWPANAIARATPVIVDPPCAGSLWRDWSFARAVCRALATAPAQLVQSHERIACCDIYRAGDGVHRVWLAERAAASRWPTRARLALNPYHWYTRRAEARLFASPRLRAVICNSRMVRDEIATHFRVGGDRLHVIYSGVDATRFNPAAAQAGRPRVRAELRIPDDALTFVLVGSGFERKGVAAAIEAVARTPATHLVIVGRESRPARYVALARRTGAADRIHFAGAQGDPLPYYGAADAFVLPTLYDPLPNAALEAMACALPVVTSAKSGAAELVVQWQCGHTCAATDTAALAAHLSSLRDTAVRRAMGERGRAGVHALTPERMAAQLTELYRALLPEPVAAAGAGASL